MPLDSGLRHSLYPDRLVSWTGRTAAKGQPALQGLWDNTRPLVIRRFECVLVSSHASCVSSPVLLLRPYEDPYSKRWGGQGGKVRFSLLPVLLYHERTTWSLFSFVVRMCSLYILFPLILICAIHLLCFLFQCTPFVPLVLLLLIDLFC